MHLRALQSYAVISVALLVSACGGGGGGGSGQNPQPPQNQTIAFATAGPMSGRAGTTVTNVASGGAGTGAITYASSDTAVATVNSTSGAATLLATGTTTITATKAASAGFNAASATYQLTVTIETQAIAFATAGPVSSRAGTTVTNVASGGAGTGGITYASSDTAIATVNSTTGVATLLAAGTTTITATKAASLGFSAASATYQLNATVETQTIAFALPGPLTVGAGNILPNAASGGAGTGAITYLSSNTSVATVDAAGVATLLTVGTTDITATKAASIGYTAATATYRLQVTPGNQTISFATPGPLDALPGATSTNVASGGAGTGAITYASGNTSVMTVNATTGAATAVGLGFTAITATKAADANYNAALASYVVRVQTADSLHAWVGLLTSQLFVPVTANGKKIARAIVDDCGPVTVDLTPCANVVSTGVNGGPIPDDQITLETAGYHAIVDGATSGVPILANVQRFSERVLHGTVFFKNRYWVIGGATPNLPGTAPPTTVHTPQSDIWSSSDGRTWRLETTTPAFGPRWLHQTLVFNNAIWILGGSTSSSGVDTTEVWRSVDGVNWTLISTGLPPTTWTPSMAATVFDNAMWIVINGQSFSSTDGITWTPRSAVAAIAGGVPREYASLTAYDNKLWYIGGASVVTVNPGPPATFARVAQNDIWNSDDGITWTLVTSNKFSARQQHAAFVLNNRLWVFGGQFVNGGPPGPPPNDAWSTADGVNWTQQALNTEIERSWLQGVVQQTNRVTFIGGVLRAYSNKVWTTTTGESWTELAPFDYAPNLLSRGVVFNGAMWVIGGGRLDGVDTNEIWRSFDGLLWSRVTPAGPIFSPRDSHRVLVFNNRMWVIGGWDFFSAEGGNEVFNNEVWSSADGVTWTQHTLIGPAFAPRAGHEAVVFQGKMWIVGGTDGNQRYNDVWSSTDGAHWVQELQAAPFTPRYTHSLLVFNNELYLFAGSGTPNGTTPSTGLQETWHSIDGRTWVQLAAPPFAARMETAATVFDGRMYVIGGHSNDDYFAGTRYNDVWSTTDGVTWRPDTSQAPFSRRYSSVLLDYKNRLYLIGGFSISRMHDVWRSEDGRVWNAAFSHPISPP